MLDPATSPIVLDISTLFAVATCVAALLGIFLLFAWAQDRVRALAWWGTAYLIGGFSVAVWSVEGLLSPPLPIGAANALLFIACGMIWNAARLFHGRPILWGALAAGATVWLIACQFAEFAEWSAGRIMLSSVIVSAYTFLTAAELWRERRKRLLRRWPAIFVPMLHGTVFLFPIPLASMLPTESGIVTLASGWVALFALEIMLYVVGTAFIVLVLAKERALRVHKEAALTDSMTGLLNRRGFLEAARQMMAREAKRGGRVCVLMFDLDHFKSINDRYGHAVGDQALRLFGAIASATMRENDVIGRFGGEEFVAVIPGTITEGMAAAERVRLAFADAAREVGRHNIEATVSAGAACGAPSAEIEDLIGNADAALYRAKLNGRNRVEEAQAGSLRLTGSPFMPACAAA